MLRSLPELNELGERENRSKLCYIVIVNVERMHTAGYCTPLLHT